MDVAAASSSSSSHVSPSSAPAAGSSPSTTNIWDSAWNACTQLPPPNLTEVLGAYAQKGDGDREMLLGILKAKSAEDQRIAAVASLHQTILQLQASALQASATNNSPQIGGGLTTPTATPPVHSPPPPHPHRNGGSTYSPPLPATAYPQAPPHQHQAYFSHPTLPPISTIRGSSPNGYHHPEPRKRARVSSQDSATGAPEYPLSPYSTGSGRSPRQHHHAPSRSGPYPPPSSSSHRERLTVSSLLGGGSEEDGDVKYRRMSAERSTR